MGFYDRDYYREPPSRNEYYHLQQPESWVLAIIVINVLVFVANMFTSGNNPEEADRINNLLMLYNDSLGDPYQWWRFLTYGFVHNSRIITHILFNMIALYMFGSLVERLYGAMEFLFVYLATIVFAGLVWAVLIALHIRSGYSLAGASGGVCGLIMLGILNFPQMRVFLFRIVEVPMWAVGVIFFGLDLLGFLGMAGCPFIAYEAHLAGVAFAALYFWQGWRFTGIPQLFSLEYWRQRRARKKFFQPRDYANKYEFDDEDADDAARRLAEAEESRSREVDAILRKISEKGKDSLTWHERRILKRASREYQEKHKPK